MNLSLHTAAKKNRLLNVKTPFDIITVPKVSVFCSSHYEQKNATTYKCS